MNCALSLSWQSSGACRYCTEWLYFSCGLSSSSPAELCFLAFTSSNDWKSCNQTTQNDSQRYKVQNPQQTPGTLEPFGWTIRLDRTFRATARPLCFFFLSLSLFLAGLFTSLMRWFSRSLLLPSLLLVVPWRGPSLLSTERPSPVDCCK